MDSGDLLGFLCSCGSGILEKLAGFLIGNTAEYVLQHVNTPVLLPDSSTEAILGGSQVWPNRRIATKFSNRSNVERPLV